MMQPRVNPQVAEQLDTCLDKFDAKYVDDLNDHYEYFPSFAESRLGQGKFGDVYRVRRVTPNGEPKEAPVVMKAIPKMKISCSPTQVQHLCAEIAATRHIRHDHVNHQVELLHSRSHVYLFLELCEGKKPDPTTRLYVLMAKYSPSRIPEVPKIIDEWNTAAAGMATEVERETYYNGVIKDFMTRQLGVRKEPPISHDLFNSIVYHKRLPERKAKIVLKQILMGLAHLHENKIVHRDMKTENVVVAETRVASPVLNDAGEVAGVRIEETINVKLIDLGLVKYTHLSQFPAAPSPSQFDSTTQEFGGSDSAFCSPTQLGQPTFGAVPIPVTAAGTEIYCALEMIEGILSSGMGRSKFMSSRDQLPKIDVYGAGTIMYCMTNGTPPFRIDPKLRLTPTAKMEKLKVLISAGPVFKDGCPETAKKMTQVLMDNDLEKRPTAKEALKSEYFADMGNTYTYEVSLKGEVSEVLDPLSNTVSRETTFTVPELLGSASSGDDSAEDSTTREGTPQAETTTEGQAAGCSTAAQADDIDPMVVVRVIEDGEADFKGGCA